MANTEHPGGDDTPGDGDHLTNEQRRAEAKRKLEQRLTTQQAAARRRKRIILTTSLVVVVAVVATGATLITKKVLDDREKARYVACAYTPTPADQDPFATPPQVPANLSPEQRTLAEQFRDQFVQGKSKQRKEQVPADRQLKKGDLQATFVTTQGTLPITLKRSEAPCNVGAVVSLIKEGYYNDTPCHRLTEGGAGKIAVLQCGDPTGTGAGGPGWTSPDEFPTNLKVVPQDPQLAALGVPSTAVYPRGTVAIANQYQSGQGGQAQGQNTGSAQMFLVINDSQLPPNYTVIGSVDPSGLPILDKVSKGGITPTIRPSQDPQTGAVTYAPTQGDGTPKLPVTVEKATVS
ncbi:peptidylprolyl isomerase [Williamsia deligens]|uniref:Peptidylprolyl isomerase n=1 Tax=Williamsia deligens TaxID=321325 RepID=A0ABW3GGQ8_9NOCA|nr:peptidylprolyl isomerase [Williamsia deligens]MCP2195351.1 peptidyl-prolyl cis-trans isomerase B (cyclophilin B) [Williamsia deligens]